MGEERLVDSEILEMIDASEGYSRYTECFFAEQAARLPVHKCWNHHIPLQDPNAKIPTGAISKTTWEVDKALRKYLRGNMPMGKVTLSRSATAAPILLVPKKDGFLRFCVDY